MPLLLPPFTVALDKLAMRRKAPLVGGTPFLQIRLLREDEAPEVAALRQEVLAKLEHPDCYVREDDESLFLALHRPPHGETVGAFAGDTLVAYAMLGLPGADDPANLGATLDLARSDRWALAHLASCMVRPAWRGLGLQRTLLSVRLALARARGRHLCAAVVSLHNHSSRHNMLRRGLHVASVGMVGGLRRQIALINLDHGLHVDPSDEWLIDSNDYPGQVEAIAHGYVGVNEIREGSGVRLRFVKRLNVQADPL